MSGSQRPNSSLKIYKKNILFVLVVLLDGASGYFHDIASVTYTVKLA